MAVPLLCIAPLSRSFAPGPLMNDLPKELPPLVRRLFWDCDPGDLSWEAHHDFIVERILSRGDWDSIQWLRRLIGDERIGEVIRRHRGRNLSPPQIRLWQLILDLPEDEVGAWLSAPSRALWDGRRA